MRPPHRTWTIGQPGGSKGIRKLLMAAPCDEKALFYSGRIQTMFLDSGEAARSHYDCPEGRMLV